jgi:O-antigen/teichoic acid export membrane protein
MGPDGNERDGLNAAGNKKVFLSRDVLLGVPWTVASKLAMTVIFLAISVLTVRLLGPSEYGVYSLCKTIVETVIIICGLGLGTALLRFIPELSIERNRAGLVKLLVKSILLQAGVLIIVGATLFLGRSMLGSWLGIDIDRLALLMFALAAARLVRGFLEVCLTASYKVRANSLLSVLQGFLNLALIVVILRRWATANAVLFAETVPVFLVAAISAYVLVRFVKELPRNPLRDGVGKRRVLGTAFASLLNAVSMLFLRQYSEIFFLGYYFSKEIVGYYSLGCSLPLMLISLLPNAIQSLFTAGFAEAHSRDPKSLSGIIRLFYKALILLFVPLAAFGAFFASRAVVLIYGPEMAPAGPVTSLFCVIHMMPLISLPISMAIVAREKIMHVQPLMVMQVVLNLLLDYLLIPRFGMWGAIGAVVFTFVSTIPIRLYVVSHFIGGIHFPVWFFVKFLVLGFGLAGIMSPMAWNCSIPGLVFAGLLYAGSYLLAIRSLRLVKPEDFAELKRMGLPKLTKALDFLTG